MRVVMVHGYTLAVLCALPTIVAATPASGQLLFVNANASGSNNGSSWTDAFASLQDALAAASARNTDANPDNDVTQVWVAGGTYMPDGGYVLDGRVYVSGSGDRTATFQLLDGVALYGGFSGVETSLGQRDCAANETILSGDLAGDDALVACTQNYPDCNLFGSFCGDDGFCVIAANNGENGYHVVTGSGTNATAVIDGFTITAGRTNSSCCVNDRGGGMYNDGGSPAVTNCMFIRNAGKFGGGLYNDSSNPTVTACTFIGNSAVLGAGMYNNIISSPTVTDCTFSRNVANFGGGMYNGSSSSPTVANSTFSGNLAATSGGGMYNFTSSPTVTHCTFTENLARGILASTGGGGMYNHMDSSPTVTDCTFSGNSAKDGGGMYSFSSSATVTNCTLNVNSANDEGGGMYNYTSSPTVINCTFSANSAGGSGGGMLNASSGPAVTDCAFNGNTAGRGGGMYTSFGSPAVTNCTFTGNSATFFIGGAGGGMYISGTGSPTVTNCTFSGNSANNDGGGMYNYYGSNPTATNCILWANVPNDIETADDTLVVNYSIVQGGWSGPGDVGVLDADPLFVDPGGADGVPGTEDDDLRLMPGSPAINAGDNGAVTTMTDLDGHARILCGVVDMGAYEFGIGDYDCNRAVDLMDFSAWGECMTAPAGGPINAGCEAFDFDGDGDVDLVDFGGFQGVLVP